MPHSARWRRSMMTNLVPLAACCANTPCARAQLGASPLSASSAFSATRSAVMSPTSSIASRCVRTLRCVATRELRLRAFYVGLVCVVLSSVARKAMIASGSKAALRIRKILAPVGSWAITLTRAIGLAGVIGAGAIGAGGKFPHDRPSSELAEQVEHLVGNRLARRRLSDRPCAGPVAHRVCGPLPSTSRVLPSLSAGLSAFA